jgi:signal transduction histidine kinase
MWPITGIKSKLLLAVAGFLIVIHVTVQDAGSGIDPKVAHRIVDAFCTTKRSGMEMGLSISRSIVEQHGRRLRAVPNDGRGTTFHFTV